MTSAGEAGTNWHIWTIRAAVGLEHSVLCEKSGEAGRDPVGLIGVRKELAFYPKVVGRH